MEGQREIELQNISGITRKITEDFLCDQEAIGYCTRITGTD